MKKVALITGASSGIGKEFAKIHASRNGDLVIIARSKQKLKELKSELENKHKIQVYIIIKDLSNLKSAEEIYNEIKENNIKISYLINNAGFGSVGKFHELELQNQINMINLNVTALTALTHLFLKDFIKDDTGKILNVSSTASFLPGPLQAVYYASKSYVQFLSNAIYEEIRETNVTISNLMPGATKTNFGIISGMDKTDLFKTTAKAKDVALAGYNGMLKGKMDIIAGVSFSQKLMFKFLPFIPKKSILKTVKKMQQIKN